VKNVVCSSAAPAAIGPYSQGIRVGHLLFVSGQLGVDPATGAFVDGGIEEQTARCLENLKAVLAESGIGLDSVVKTTVLLANMDDFAAMNEVYASYFKTDPPARSAFQVARLPKNGRVEIEAIAWVE
jgi:2-iminobutanoate/2-iminopropanoate deaminase